MAIEKLDELNRRFPESVYQQESYYNLYQLYKLQNNQKKADYYKNLLINKFPHSKYAMIFTNPNYLKQLPSGLRQANPAKFHLIQN